ncbi:hypothetical protein [Aquirufa regiilacus]|uniref:DUF1983 domain-containing protein n=1 Tax=Aquirufa regiilacus TaxID=3024868 RepID=A0ABU3TUD7_9BACT|nr:MULTISPECIES: hypothetical protein [unclassified Aquirufa]MDT8888244.1 hypothetical protein [Aquirufa sp. LEPPI-3A]MDU0809491.1 hypothetical protein [Aquirufa sp. LEOWEIH-7C]
MNKLFYSLLILLGSFSLIKAQIPKKSLNYQAVIIDPKVIDIPGSSISGQALSKGNVCIRFSILGSNGQLEYEEYQKTITDDYGLVNLSIGAGQTNLAAQSISATPQYSSFESIVWNANLKSLQVSVSYDGCQSFKQVSAQSLTYTPYALYADAVEYKNVLNAPTKLSQFSNDAGFLVPNDLNPIKVDLAIMNQTIVQTKQQTDSTFRVVNQSISSTENMITEHTQSITDINTLLEDHQLQIYDNKNQINSAVNNLGGIQSQLNQTVSTVNNLSGSYEVLDNKSSSPELGGANPSDILYPTQKATKTYVDNTIYEAVGTGVPNATTLTAGKVKLAGDLSGTAQLPTVPALSLKENAANKSTNIQSDGASDSKYPSVKAVKDYVDQATLGVALATTVSGKADIASPTFTGTPSAPTASAGTNTTQIATTAYVQGAIASATVNDATANSKGIIQLAGDLAGSASSPSVSKIQGITVSGIVPSNGQVLTYNGSIWVPTNPLVFRSARQQVRASAGQTSFTLSQNPSADCQVYMYINGIRTNNEAYSWSGATLTYVPASNNAYVLTLNDRVQFDFIY